MISVNNIDKIKILFARIFFYGLSKDYSYEYIEKKICDSFFVRMLEEHNDDSFIYNSNIFKVIDDIYLVSSSNVIKEDTLSMNSLCLWLGEAYVRLFFKFAKSFSFIFLYFPLSTTIQAFNIYHEMDFVQLYDLFEELINKETILNKLLKKRSISKEQLSILSGINKNTISNYSRSNDNIYFSNYHNLFIISKILDVNINVFASNIMNKPSESMYLYNKEDEEYRRKLGLLFAEYYIKEIRDAHYIYDTVNGIYKSGDFYLKVLWTKYQKGLNFVNTNQNMDIRNVITEYLKNNNVDVSKLSLIIFEFNDMNESIDRYLSLNEFGLKNIFIINQQYFFQINNHLSRTRNITSTVNEYLMQRASLIAK